MKKCRWDFVKIPCVIPSRTGFPSGQRGRAVPGCRCYRATSLTVSCIVTPLRTFSYVSFRGPVPESRWIDLRVRAPYVSPADCVLAASCASLGFIPAQAGIGAIQCERTRATPEQSYFLLLWTKIGRLRNTKITGAGWSPLFHRDIFICTMIWIPGRGPGMTIFYFATCGLGGVTERMAKKALLSRHPVRGADTPAPQRGNWSATGGVICVSGTGLICFFVECYIPCI